MGNMMMMWSQLFIFIFNFDQNNIVFYTPNHPTSHVIFPDARI